MSGPDATPRRCHIGALCAFEYVCFVLLDPAERFQPAERCTTIVNRIAEPAGQAPCALHPARAWRVAATALRHCCGFLRATLVHDLGHQADRLALCGHARSCLLRKQPRGARLLLFLSGGYRRRDRPSFHPLASGSRDPCCPAAVAVLACRAPLRRVRPLALPLLCRLFCFSGRVGAVIPVLFGDAVHFDSPPQQVCCRLTVGVSPLRERTGTRPI